MSGLSAIWVAERPLIAIDGPAQACQELLDLGRAGLPLAEETAIHDIDDCRS